MCSKAALFQMDEFHGVDLTCLHEDAMLEYFRQPCVEQINPACLVGQPSTQVRLCRPSSRQWWAEQPFFTVRTDSAITVDLLDV